MKTEVYSWRLSRYLKSDLEREARLRRLPLSALLDLAVSEWLKRNSGELSSDEAQRKLHASAARCLGAIAGRNPRRAETAREAIRKRLRRRHAR
jgi:hypothetical protein